MERKRAVRQEVLRWEVFTRAIVNKGNLSIQNSKTICLTHFK
jgi:hypothetical protein